MSGLEPGSTLEDRYRIDRVVSNRGGTYYLGTALETRARVKVLELPPLVLRPLSRAQLHEHAHLCSVLETIPRAGGNGLAVVEHVPGRTLREVFEERPTLDIQLAVTATLDLSDALVSLHQRGAAHGLLTPDSIIVEPEGRSSVLLGFSPLCPPPNPYHCPERGIGPPSLADDVWALVAVLHQMLVGRPPPVSGYNTRNEVIQAGIDQTDLVELLGSCLAKKRERRVSRAPAVREMLSNMFTSAVATPLPKAQPSPSGVRVPPLSTPSSPPLRIQSWASEPSQPEYERPPPTPVPVGISQAKPQRSVPMAPLIGGGTAVALAIVGGLYFASVALLGSASSAASATPLSAAPLSDSGGSGPATANTAGKGKAAASARVPAASSAVEEPVPLDQLPKGQELAECLVAQFPPASFDEPPSVDWLCTITDPRQGYARLRSTLVLGSGGRVTDAMKLWSQVQWYGMATFTVYRASCCPGAPELELPATVSCTATAEILNELTLAVAAGKDWDPVIERYTRNVRCHSVQKRQAFFGVNGPLGAGQRSVFDQLTTRSGRR